MVESKEQNQEQAVKTQSPPETTAPPAPRKRFWTNPWIIIGVITFALSVAVTLMNNTDLTINLIGASLTIKLPLLILGSALLGGLIEFFIVIGPNTDIVVENRRLRQIIRELKR